MYWCLIIPNEKTSKIWIDSKIIILLKVWIFIILWIRNENNNIVMKISRKIGLHNRAILFLLKLDFQAFYFEFKYFKNYFKFILPSALKIFMIFENYIL